MDLMQMLIKFFMLGVCIKVAVDSINLMVKPFKDIKKYSLITAFCLSVMVFTSFNYGLFEALEIPIKDVSFQPYFHFVDMFITSVIGMSGALGFHKVVKAIASYIQQPEVK